MDTFNLTLTRAADWVFGWCQRLSPLATLLLLSAVAGVAMAVVFRVSSNQRAIKAAVDRSRAQVLAINLFGHDPRAIFASFAQLLRYTGLRLSYSLPPMLLMLIPFTLLLVQLAMRYEHQPLAGGESTIVKLELAPEAWSDHQRVALKSSPQVKVETPALRDATEHAVYWRVRPLGSTPAVLAWQIDGQTIEKRLDVSGDDVALSAVGVRRPGRGIVDRLLYPAEPALPAAGPVRGIEVQHAPRQTPLFGLDVPWWLTFVLGSIVAALLLRPILRVRY
ncbi:MAG: hypothetical protein DWQ37_18650 [Planctomycetota bacterium]|nr:MAG: hypothetical protein DWQ37_18650 [Planctomycetota bacterium]